MNCLTNVLLDIMFLLLMKNGFITRISTARGIRLMGSMYRGTSIK